MLSFLILCNLGIQPVFLVETFFFMKHDVLCADVTSIRRVTAINYSFTSLLNIQYIYKMFRTKKYLHLDIVFVFARLHPLLPFTFLSVCFAKSYKIICINFTCSFFFWSSNISLHFILDLNKFWRLFLSITQVPCASRRYHLDGTVCSSVVSVRLCVYHPWAWLFSS